MADTCKHPRCGQPIVRCETRPAHGGCSSARGWLHVGTYAHACEPRSDGPYAEPFDPTSEDSEDGHDLRTLQQTAYANKVAQGFNTTDVPLEFCLLSGEVAEAFEAWRKQAPVGEELADVVIFAAGLAEILGVDLAAEVERKLAVNAAREYVRLPNGTPVKISGDRNRNA